MSRLAFIALVLVLAATIAVAKPQERLRPADRNAVVALLKREGIVGQNARVIDVNWARDFWIVTVRHASGKKTSWQVDAMARDYSYICQH